MNSKNRINEIRKERGISMERLAEMVGTSRGQIYNLEKGNRQLTQRWMVRLGNALNCKPEEFIARSDEPMVPVLGYVGAGAEIFPIDDHATGACMEEVECPAGYSPENVIALRVRGDSMEPQIEDGWLVFYKRKYNDGVPHECIGQLCVVKLKNDGMLVKKLRQGSAPGLYHLYSKNQAHEPIIDAKIEWASKVIDIRPC